MKEESFVGKEGGHPMFSAYSPLRQKKGKVVTAEEAVRVIRDGDTVATSGFVGAGFAEEIAAKLEEYYLATGKPRNLTLVYAAGQGDGSEKGLNHMGHEGLVRRVIGGHIGLAPKLQKLIRENKILAYNFPQGVISHLFRDIAARKVGTITTVGMGTYIDPRNDGGKLNELTKKEGEDLIKVINLEAAEYLLYKAFPINVALIRGTTADTNGNVTMEKEALTQEALAIAMAAKNSNGFVIAQVERVAEHGTLNARNVKIPGILVDCVVVSRPENHWQTFATPYNPAFSCEIKIPMQSIPPMDMSERKIISRRAAFELKANMVVNLGIGMPEGIAQVANEEKILDLLTLTAEPGVIGGIPAGGLNFGAGTNMEALIDQPYQFDFYDGGGLDVAFLGLAQADQYGNLNVSKFGPRFTGPGGFINISQRSKKIVFVGTFTAGKLKVSIEDGKLRIVQEGKERKFLKQVEQVTFSGKYAAEKGQPVLYITERCVFQLTPQGMELIEIAPGIDLKRDILAQMDFQPVILRPRMMDSRIFRLEPMGLKEELLTLPLEERLIYNPAEDLFFVNFEGLYIKSSEQIQYIKSLVEKILAPLGRKVYTFVNYDNFNILPELVDEYTDAVKDLVVNYYEGVTRFTTSTFLRMKLGESLEKRHVAPHIYESREEARKALKKD
jgi:propionate CoA-transferase